MSQDKDAEVIRNNVMQVFRNWSSMVPETNDPYYLADDRTVLFDINPMKDIGWNTQKERLKKVFKGFEYFNMVPNEDLAVHYAGNLGWVTTTWKFEIHLKNGEKIQEEGRGTFVLQRANDKWLVVHDHISIPSPD
jgi:ketosteroid isomerase-like protein